MMAPIDPPPAAIDGVYRELFSAIDEGFCLCEMILDSNGEPVDYRFIEVNPQFESMTGLVDAPGRTAYELVPDLEASWIATYGTVALGGTAMRFQNGSAAMGRWFDVFATPVAPYGRFALVFRDTTEHHLAEVALKESEERFRNMADHAPLMMWVSDADGRCTYLNDRWFTYTGQSPTQDWPNWAEAVHPDDIEVATQDMGRALRARESFAVEFRLRRKDGEFRWTINSAAARFAADGGFHGYVGSVIDIHDRVVAEDAVRSSEARQRQRRQRAELLAEMISEIEAIESGRGRHRRVVEMLVLRFADVAVIDVDGVREARSGAADVDPLLFDSDAGNAETPCATRIEAPIVVGGDHFGTLMVGRTTDSFNDDDRAFIAIVAERIGVILNATRLREREHQIALRLQRALLPDTVVQHPRVEIAARYAADDQMLEVGGDWYDTAVLDDGSVLAVVGDVVGHDLEAAVMMGRLRAVFAVLATRTSRPGQLLRELDEYARGAADFTTACCIVVDPDTGQLTYSSAGHPPPLVVSPSGETRWLEGGRSTPLCVGPLLDRPEDTTTVERGSTVILYSDGLVERRGLIDIGLSRLESAAAALCGLPLEALIDQLMRHLDTATAGDDVVVVALRLR